MRNERGFLLPVAVMAVLVTLAVGIALSGVYMQASSKQAALKDISWKAYLESLSGQERARFYLIQTSKHKWSEGSTTTLSMTTPGATVTVVAEDDIYE